MNRFVLGSWLVMCAVGLVATCAAARVLDEIDVHELEREAAKYQGREVRVVGRFASAGAGRMRLVGSNIEFRLGPEVQIHTNPRFVELQGRLSGTPGRLVFQVERLNRLPPDIERFEQRREKLSRVNYPALYELSEQAAERVEWYEDELLRSFARDAWGQAFRWEEAELARQRRAEDLLRLAERGAQRELAAAELQRVRYRAVSLKADQLPPGDADGRMELAEELAELLPGSDQPSATEVEPPAAGQGDRVAEYAQADQGTRRKLQRAFYVELVQQALMIEAKQPVSDLAALVRRAEALVPQQQALIAELKRLELERRAGGLAQMSRREMLALRGDFEGQGLDQRSTEVTQSWLNERRRRLEAADVEDRVALARDYRQLLRDETTAEALYREALAISPSADAEQGLAEMGLVKMGASWRRPRTVDAPLGEDSAIGPGDSEQAVRQSLGPPDGLARTVGGGWMVEQWRYDGPPALWVYLRRSTATGQASVVRIVAP